MALVNEYQKKIEETEAIMQEMRAQHDVEVDGVRGNLEAEMEDILAEKDPAVDTLLQAKEAELAELEATRNAQVEEKAQKIKAKEEEVRFCVYFGLFAHLIRSWSV